MKRSSYGLCIVLLLLFTISAQAQMLKAVKWSYAAKKISDKEAVIYLKAVIGEGWHVFSVNQKPGGPQKTSFTFAKSLAYNLAGKVKEPMPIIKFDDTFKVEIMYFEDEVVFQQKVKFKAGNSDVIIKGKVEFMACNENQCLPPEEIEFSIPIK